MKTKRLAIVLVVGALVLFTIANVLSWVAACTYDDLPNTWSCNQAWATPLIGYFDPIIFLVAYPAFAIGLLILLFTKLFRPKETLSTE